MEVKMTITTQDAKVIIGMVKRGDAQHNVAAWFGENPGRVAEALQGAYGTSEAAPKESLPPSGAPGIKGRRLKAFAEKALSALENGKIDEAKKLLEDGIARFNRQE